MGRYIVKDVSRLEFEERCVVSQIVPETGSHPRLAGRFAAASASSETSAGPFLTPTPVSGNLLIEEGIVVRVYARIHPID